MKDVLPDNLKDLIKDTKALYLPNFTDNRLSMGAVVEIVASHPKEIIKVNPGVHSINIIGLELRSSTPAFIKDFLIHMKESLLGIVDKIEDINYTCQLMIGTHPESKSAFFMHADSMDVIIVQAYNTITVDIGASGYKPDIYHGAEVLETYTLKPGDALFVPANTLHHIHPQGERVTLSYGFEYTKEKSLRHLLIDAN